MEPIVDHEKLDVYGLELQFVAWTADFLKEVSQSPVSPWCSWICVMRWDFEHEHEEKPISQHL
jgi:hypothetical protein